MSRRVSAGRPTRSSRMPPACASPSPRRAAARNEVLEADYVVGCDGGHSIVRRQIGIERSGADFDQLMVLALFRSRELHEKLKRFPPRSTYRVLHPDLKGYWQFFGRVDVGESWFFHSPVPASTTRDNYDFHGLLQQVAGFDFACDFDYVGFWDLRIAVAENYQVGRVFIAGDAAHSHPPYGGYGLNNGLDDVANLGWKLAAKLQGWGSDALLQSYSEERQPIFQGDRPRFHRGRHPEGRGVSRPLQPGEGPRRIRARLEGSSRRRRAARAHLRAALRRLADRVRPAGRPIERPRHAHLQGPRRPSPAAAASKLRPQRVRGTRAGFHAAGVRRGRQHRCGVRRRPPRRSACR